MIWICHGQTKRMLYVCNICLETIRQDPVDSWPPRIVYVNMILLSWRHWKENYAPLRLGPFWFCGPSHAICIYLHTADQQSLYMYAMYSLRPHDKLILLFATPYLNKWKRITNTIQVFRVTVVYLSKLSFEKTNIYSFPISKTSKKSARISIENRKNISKK